MRRLDLTGRTAVITGGARGIGYAAAQAISAAGGNVVLTSRQQKSADAAAAELPGNALGMAARAIDEIAAQRCVDAAIDRFGSVDILVNNADTNPSHGPVIDQDYMRFTKTFGVNVWAPILWTSLVTRAWMGEHGGVVINTASIGGPGFDADLGLYNASKAALIHLTRQLAFELSPNVRVNAVAPGLVRTEQAEDIGAAIAFLASGTAGWVTGETFLIDGGQRLADAASLRASERGRA
ncbi:SDR family oxidoreductase [Nocardia sp. NPDC057663]|uniref:SDR family oxidoreductase n=1 Tax=Nocardia sp. NPDC057663 TaxID=3346201 RepID=UPI0036715149